MPDITVDIRVDGQLSTVSSLFPQRGDGNARQNCGHTSRWSVKHGQLSLSVEG